MSSQTKLTTIKEIDELVDQLTDQLTQEFVKPIRAVVLDNDDTTGSYGIVFSILTHLRKTDILDEGVIETILIRLGHQMDFYKLFRPGLGHFMKTLAFLKDEDMIDTVIMYTNQVEEYPYNKSESLMEILYNIPYAISFLIYATYRVNIFDDVLSRPRFFQKLTNSVCTKSFSRIFDLDRSRPKDTRDILFVDDKASPSFISASTETVTHRKSYYRIAPYVRVLDDAELDSFLNEVFENINIRNETLHSIKELYRRYSPLSKIVMNNLEDRELIVLNTFVIDKYV